MSIFLGRGCDIELFNYPFPFVQLLLGDASGKSSELEQRVVTSHFSIVVYALPVSESLLFS